MQMTLKIIFLVVSYSYVLQALIRSQTEFMPLSLTEMWIAIILLVTVVLIGIRREFKRIDKLKSQKRH